MKLAKICYSIGLVVGMLVIIMYSGDRRMHAITRNRLTL
jgi:hypothetical protein